MPQTGVFINENSQTLLINGFKKEFRTKLKKVTDSYYID